MTAPHSVLTELPVLGGTTSPLLAALIGFLTGGIGLAIYFKSFRDLFPVEAAAGLAVVGALVTGVNALDVAVIVTAVVGGLYGWWRARSSNRRRGASIVPIAAGSAG